MKGENAALESLIAQQNQLLSAIDAQLKASHYTEALIVGLIVALGGAVAAYMFSRLQIRQEKARNNIKTIATNLHEMVSELENLSLKYWLKDADPGDSEMSIRIKSVLRLIRKYKNTYKSTATLDADRLSVIQEFNSRIYDVVTGGDFESPNRKKNSVRAAAIARECTSAKALLSEIVISA